MKAKSAGTVDEDIAVKKGVVDPRKRFKYLIMTNAAAGLRLLNVFCRGAA
jgi:hypothetical protein